ncbi:MAG: cation diffusion facilitator family transporter [Isosphaeraceae bacterium]|nr:cation diffusion facilitator family transporter [Isosphaeraceae bacterium]
MGETDDGSVVGLYRQARRAAAWGLALSVGLGSVKLAGGVFGHSFALVSDAAHSLVDALISVTLLGALAISQRPPDHEHPYGHGRLESVAGLLVALLMLGLALGIGWEAIGSAPSEHPLPHGYTIAIAAFGALFQEGLFHYARDVARRTGSTALLATAWDYRLDALGSLVVLAGVALARWGGPSWHWADHAAAATVAASVLWVGGNLFRDNVQDLMDRQADPDVLRDVRREALGVEGVLGVEKLRVRKTGLEYLVDIHVEVDPEISVREGHAIAHAVKDRIVRSIVAVRDVLVHVEPHALSAARSSL